MLRREFLSASSLAMGLSATVPADAAIFIAGTITITLSSFTYLLVERRLTKALSPILHRSGNKSFPSKA